MLYVNGHKLESQDSVESSDLPELHVFKRRWYILAVFCGLSCHQVKSAVAWKSGGNFQALVWNTWGPIESGAQFAFGWSPATVAMFANWGTIMFLVSVVPLSKMIEVCECGDSCITLAGQPSPHCSFCFWSHGIGDNPQMWKKICQTAVLGKRQPASFSHQVSNNAPREDSI